MTQSVSVKEQLGMHHNCKLSCGQLKHDTMVVNKDWAGIVFLKFPKLGFYKKRHARDMWDQKSHAGVLKAHQRKS